MKKGIRYFLLSAMLLIAGNLTVSAQNAADKVLGVYDVTAPGTSENSHVRIFKAKDGTYAGRVIWLKEPNFEDGTPKRDIKNPDPAKRDTPGDQILLMKGFSYNAEKNEWSGGTIYNPVNGKTYKCYMKFESDTKLKVRGYIGVPALGESMYWFKIK